MVTLDVDALYRAERGRVLRAFGARRDAEDLLHDAFVEVLRGAAGFRGESKPSTWLYRIARSTLLMRVRAARIRARLDVLAFTEPEPVPRPDELAERREERDVLGRAVNRLTPARRAVVELHLRDLEHNEVAARLRIPVGTVRSRLFCARRQLGATG